MKLSLVTLSRGDDHGYAVVSRELSHALTDAGAELLQPWKFGADLTVAFALPCVFFFEGERRRPDLVLHTMVEVEPTPPDWIPSMNRCGAIWAPSQWVADRFRADGVTVPIFVSGYGIDEKVHYPVEGREVNHGTLRVGIWGDSFGSRKRVLAALQCFIDANLPDAVCEIKVNARDLITPKTVKMHGEEESRITIINQSWPIVAMTNWLRSLDVMVYLSGGEGYGLMPLETMACGVPVISGMHTGMLEYMTEENSLTVPSDGMIEAPSYEYRFGEKGFMRECDLSAVIDRLHWADAHRAELLALGERAAKDAAQFTWKRAGEQALASLQAYSSGLVAT